MSSTQSLSTLVRTAWESFSTSWNELFPAPPPKPQGSWVGVETLPIARKISHRNFSLLNDVPKRANKLFWYNYRVYDPSPLQLAVLGGDTARVGAELEKLERGAQPPPLTFTCPEVLTKDADGNEQWQTESLNLLDFAIESANTCYALAYDTDRFAWAKSDLLAIRKRYYAIAAALFEAGVCPETSRSILVRKKKKNHIG